MKCYYHDDLDGRCAAYIVYSKHPKCQTIPCLYEKEIDIGSIENEERIYIVDFSFKPKIMNEILEITSNIVWIDHHETAFKYEKEYSKEIDGIRNDELSGCELTWFWFKKGEKWWKRWWEKYEHTTESSISSLREQCGTVVRLIGDYDTWTHAYDNSRPFHIGLSLINTNPTHINWELLFESSGFRWDIIKHGKICEQFRGQIMKEYREKFSFECKYHGYDMLINGVYMFGSLAFGDIIDQYDICVSYAFNGKKWVIGLYSNNPGIHVGIIAQSFGGGGHKGAAGFVSNDPPWVVFKEREEK